jgi:hypothetical protein
VRKLDAFRETSTAMGYPMANALKPGERIRLTTKVREGGYRAGDRGIVLSGDQANESGWLSYYVRMEGQPMGAWTRFTNEEIERDSEPEATRLICYSAEIQALMQRSGAEELVDE